MYNSYIRVKMYKDKLPYIMHNFQIFQCMCVLFSTISILYAIIIKQIVYTNFSYVYF